MKKKEGIEYREQTKTGKNANDIEPKKTVCILTKNITYKMFPEAVRNIVGKEVIRIAIRKHLKHHIHTFVGRASCNNDDKYDENYGRLLAYTRANAKYHLMLQKILREVLDKVENAEIKLHMQSTSIQVAINRDGDMYDSLKKEDRLTKEFANNPMIGYILHPNGMDAR